MIDRSKELELSLGDGIKKIEDNEKESYVVQRRSICASRDLCADDVLSSDDLTYLRPRPKNSFSPMETHLLVGAKVACSISMNEPIMPHHIILK